MTRKRLVRLSLALAATLLSSLALLTAPAPAGACFWVCASGFCPPGKVYAYNHCNPPQKACVSICATQ